MVLNQTMGQQPIVIPAALILEILNEIVRDKLAREMLDGLADGLAVGFANFDENAIHIEHQDAGTRGYYQIFSSSVRNFCT